MANSLLWNITIFNRYKTTNYFDWVIFNSYVKLSEGNLSMISGFYHDQ